MTEKLKTEMEKILGLEVEFLKRGKQPSSSAFFITPTGKFVVHPIDLQYTPKTKKFIRKIARKKKATMVITATNSFISKLEGTPTDPPYFRREVILIYGETKSSNYAIGHELERMGDGGINIGKRFELPDGLVGPMTGFLSR